MPNLSARRWATSLLLAAAAYGCGGEDEPEGPDPLVIVTEALPGGGLRAAYDHKLEVAGGTPPYRFSIAEGALPEGCELLEGQGRITGTLEAPGRADFTVEVSDAAQQSATQALFIEVEPDPLLVKTSSVPEGFTQTDYWARIDAEGGMPPHRFDLMQGSLPTGLSFDEDGHLSGTPAEVGAFEFVVRVRDRDDREATATLMLTVRNGVPMITTETLPFARVGERYEVRVEAEGGMPPYEFAVAGGALPEGLELQSDGLIFGTPAAASEGDVVIEVRDAADKRDARTFAVPAIEPLVIATRNLPVAMLASPYSFDLEAQGGLAPYSWSTVDSLPPGLTLSAEGTLSGTPTELGQWSMRVRVQDATLGAPRSARLVLTVRDVRQYEVQPALDFPPVCTSTRVSYQTAELVVPDSFSILNIEVSVDIAYQDTRANDRSRLKVVLWAPDGRRSVLCGNGAGVRGSSGCRGSGDLRVTYADGTSVRPQVPLRVFEGMNPQGTWRLQAAVVNPTEDGGCQQSGTIERLALTIEPDPASEPYVIMSGFTYNNLLIDPWVRITGGGLPQQRISLSATLWHPGPNGLREGGRGDDVPDPVEFTFVGDDLPAGASVAPDGTVQAGPDTSGADSRVTATDASGTYSVTRPLHVTPPDWHPKVRDY